MASYLIYLETPDSLYTSFIDLDKSTKTKIADYEISYDNEQFIIDNDIVDNIIIKEHQPKHFYIDKKIMITLGNNHANDFVLETNDAISLSINTKQGIVHNYGTSNIYLNNNKINEEAKIANGDRLYFNGYELIYNQEIITFLNSDNLASKHVEQKELAQQLNNDTFDFQRSPRIIYVEPTEEIEILDAGNKPQKPSEGLARLVVPPAIMLIMTILMAIFIPNGLYALMGVVTTLVTIIFNVISYVDRVKQFKKDTIERNKRYTIYLDNVMARITKQLNEQKYAAKYHAPNIDELCKMALNYHYRIFEKTVQHHDFLAFRVGQGSIKPSFSIKYEKNIMELDKEALILRADAIYDHVEELADVPINIDLLHGPIGFVGRHDLVREQLQLMLLQLAFFHSYLDVEFISVFKEEEYPEWHQFRWLPHFKMNDLNVRSMVYHQKSVDQVLNSLAQILKQRQTIINEKGREKVYFNPHYVFVISDEKLIFEHPVYELIENNPIDLGVSVVYTNSVVQKLPEFVKTIVQIKNNDEAQILIQEGKLLNQKIKLDHLSKQYNYEMITRRLASLNHIVGVKNSIPERVTFLEMYNVNHVEQLNVLNRYDKSAPHKTLAVPLGYRAKDDIVYLNLHEKAHGPHGLVAGTTGSGKSEIVQSYILSLALNFHPYDVAFLLIDYKGGGMANLFKDLPHHLGSITNLDGSQSMRALVSINAELKRRQRMFGEHEVNHINQYHKLFKEGLASEPIPHLFIISDEFAELKAEQPEFMKELVSTARIGRSLGVHLILATQKPSGVVDEQIWSNSKFKLALKVQNASDSNEVLKTPDAANITLPGRAYLQVGNNEIYELFQSAWSGADYIMDEEISEVVDERIYKINEMGQYELLSQDLSGLKDHHNHQVVSQLEAVINYIDTEIKTTDYQAVARPWLPPLPTKLSLFDANEYDLRQAWSKEDNELKFTLGLVDLPQLQAQEPLEINLSEDGHFIVYSSPGYGKSTTLQTIIMDLSRKLNPEYLELFLLDFGTNSLLPLRNLPSVADLVLADEDEKMSKLILRLSHEVKRRKKLCQEVSAPSIAMYEKLTGKKERRIIIAIDNYDVVKESDLSDNLEPLLIQLSREGLAVGIHLIISASAQNALRYTMSANFKHQMCLFMIDTSDVSSIVGRSEYKIEELAGRAMIKVEEPVVLQTYLPVEGEDNVEILENITKEVSQINELFTGKKPKAIPIMPEVIEFDEFINNDSVKEDMEKQYVIPLGYDYQDVESASIDFSKVDNFFVAGGTSGSQIDALKNIMETLKVKNNIFVLFDSARNELAEYKNKSAHYENDPTKYTELIKDIIFEKEHLNEEELIYIIINNASEFCESLSENEELEDLYQNALHHKLRFIYGHDADNLAGFSPIAKAMKKNNNGLLLHKISDQGVHELPYISREPDIEDRDGYIFINNKHQKLKTITNR